jgi:ATP-binding cassette subfamily A (ABC1) protein 3
VAVSNLSFQVDTGECFALLGVNGAGKSTTYKSLTHEVVPTSGSVSVYGFDLVKNFRLARRVIGYCPQANILFEFMSVEEHVYFYASIKGIPITKIKGLVEQTISQLDLQKQRYKTAGTLSGGNKRKLCVAIALIGNPAVILLDEPSAGMDPEARRFMWSVVQGYTQRKTSAIIISTHSMDEAEALSTKMGIMVKGGVLKCIGSA